MNIVLVDDHPILRDGLRAVLEKEADLRVVGEAAEGQVAVDLCERLSPDVVVMDILLPGLNGIEATRKLSALRPATRVVALSINADRRYVHAMFEAGASGYLVKNAAAEELIRAVRAVGSGEKYVSPAVAGLVLERFVSNAPAKPEGASDSLTPREREVLQLLAEGFTSKEIAARLELAVSTVETHRKQIMAKLELRSVAELTKFAIRRGLTSLD